MTDTEISDYIDNMLKNISRVRNTIKRFSEELNNNNNEIEDNNNNNNINDNNNNIINDNLIVSPQEIVDCLQRLLQIVMTGNVKNCMILFHRSRITIARKSVIGRFSY